jgi:CHRD domain
MRPFLLGATLAVATVAACSSDRGSPLDTGEVVVPVYSLGMGQGSENLRTHMNGGEENPANESQAQGQAIFRLSEDGTELQYKLIVANIENVLQSHIHMAAPGVNGGIVVWLYPSAPPASLIPGRTDGILAEGVIRDANVIGALSGQGLAGLMAAIHAGNTYVNVHTTQHPPGEIRGQID